MAFEREPGTSIDTRTGEPTGPWVRFIKACLRPILAEAEMPTGTAIRERTRRVMVKSTSEKLRDAPGMNDKSPAFIMKQAKQCHLPKQPSHPTTCAPALRPNWRRLIPFSPAAQRVVVFGPAAW